MILYGFLEPQWDFSGEAPNDVPRDLPDTHNEQTLVHQQYYQLPNSVFPMPTRIWEAPKGPFIFNINQGYWPTPSGAIFLRDCNTVYYGAPPAPAKTGYQDEYAQATSYPNPSYFAGQAPTTGLYTGLDDEY